MRQRRTLRLRIYIKNVGHGKDEVSKIRVEEDKNTDVPCAIGFGISTPEQARKMSQISDGAIVGSAIIKIIEKYGKDAPLYVGEYVKEMKNAIK